MIHSIIRSLVTILLFSTSLYAQTNERLLIINEGSFGLSNASIDVFDMETKVLQNEVFASANDDAILGDIAQSAYRFNDDLFIVVNNSNRVLRIDAQTFEIQDVIDFQNQESPRTVVVDKEGIVYVTLMATGEVAKLRLDGLQEIERIKVGNWPDKMVVNNDKIFVSNWGSRYYEQPDSTVMIIDIESAKVTDTVYVKPSPRDMLFDDEGKFWVISSDYGYESAVQIFDTELNLMKTISYEDGLGEDINSSGDWIFVNHAGIGIERIGKTSLEKDSDVFLAGSFYSVKISDTQTPILAVADPKDYSQRGEVTLFDMELNEIAKFQSGVIPGHFVFMEADKNVATEPSIQPNRIGLMAAYPNPFNPSTNISVSVVTDGLYNISAYDVSGRLLETLYNGFLSAQNTRLFTWNATAFPSGVYMIMLSGENIQVLKVHLLR